MRVWTIQLAQWRKAKEQGIQVVDITWASGDRFFAPTAELLRAYKNGFIGSAEYTELFQKIMQARWRENSNHWETLFKFEDIALGCYCGAGEFCHRHLVRDYAEKTAKHLGYPFEYIGEIT